jgi:hypothetical protein
VLPNQQRRGSIRVARAGFEAWIDEHEEASRDKLKGSMDGDVCTCNCSNLVGHSCKRLRYKALDVVWQQ